MPRDPEISFRTAQGLEGVQPIVMELSPDEARLIDLVREPLPEPPAPEPDARALGLDLDWAFACLVGGLASGALIGWGLAALKGCR